MDYLLDTGTDLQFSPETQQRMMEMQRARSLQAQPVQPQGGEGGIIEFFKSLFGRQNELDEIMNQNGLRQPVSQPATGGVRG
jgi:hypothetical protein